VVDVRTQRLFAYTGPLLMVVFLAGFLIAGFVPPLSPNESTQGVVSYFSRHTDAIRIGVFITGFAAALVVPWCVAISLQIRRISPQHVGYAYAELMLGTLLLVEFIVPLMIWEAAAFRPLLSPETTLRLNDLASLMFVGVVATAVLEAALLGVAILKDPRAQPLFRRWVGWFNLAIAVAFIPGGFCVFTKTGPLAWDGAISWWFALGAFGAWIGVVTYETVRAIDAQEREEQARPTARSESLAMSVA
jgi:hypothetical protein